MQWVRVAFALGLSSTLGSLAFDAPAQPAQPAQPVQPPQPAREARIASAPALVRNGRARLAVDDRGRAAPRVTALAKSLGGRMVSQDDRKVVVELPGETWHEFGRRLHEIGDAGTLSISTEDVTDRIADAESALRAAESRRDRLRGLGQKARNMGENVGAEHELEQAENAITEANARLRDLRQQTTAVRVVVELTAPEVERLPKGTPELPFPWLNRLGLPQLLNPEMAPSEHHWVLRGLVDGTFEGRLLYFPNPHAIDAPRAAGAAALTFRMLGEANPIGIYGGFDLALGGGGGFLYDAQGLLGVGVPIGRRFAIEVATGPGIDALTSVIPAGITLPIELRLSLDLLPFAHTTLWAQDGWVFAQKKRRDGSKRAPFGDEAAVGLLALISGREEGGYTQSRLGPLVGFTYRELLGTRIYEFSIGFGAQKADYSE